MKSCKDSNQYFIGTMYKTLEMETLIKNRKIKDEAIQIIVKEAKDIKRLTWFLLQQDISFQRKPLGSGITSFFVDFTEPFFMNKKNGKEVL